MQRDGRPIAQFLPGDVGATPAGARQAGTQVVDEDAGFGGVQVVGQRVAAIRVRPSPLRHRRAPPAPAAARSRSHSGRSPTSSPRTARCARRRGASSATALRTPRYARGRVAPSVRACRSRPRESATGCVSRARPCRSWPAAAAHSVASPRRGPGFGPPRAAAARCAPAIPAPFPPWAALAPRRSSSRGSRVVCGPDRPPYPAPRMPPRRMAARTAPLRHHGTCHPPPTMMRAPGDCPGIAGAPASGFRARPKWRTRCRGPVRSAAPEPTCRRSQACAGIRNRCA